VDIAEGKNLVGAFWQPAGVLCDTRLLETLPEREWASGRGEIAKYVLLVSAGPDAEERAKDLLDAEVDEQVARCVAIKARIVAADEREDTIAAPVAERGRVVLNYGHTLAHALEAASLCAGGDLRHGEAVGVGLVYAAILARLLGRIGDEKVAFHRAVVERFGLQVRPPDFEPKELVAFMARDKKAEHDLSFVLDGPRGLELVRGVGEAQALAALEELTCT
jgi:5-deoxy-5-amino-3-dehydroquinate synthase